MDVLSNVLQAVRLNGAVFFDVRAGTPMVAETPPMAEIGHMVMPGSEHVIPFHIMLNGRCWVEAIGGPDGAAVMEEGDIVIYPHGHPHVFGSEPGQRMKPDLSNYVRRDGPPMLLRLNEDSPVANRFVCGYLGCDATPFNPLLEALPCQLLAKRRADATHIEVELIHSAVEESAAGRAGSATILARLSELLFVRVMRRYIEQLPEHSEGWLAALRNVHMSRALELIHGEPARDWTIETLARECGLSRATFAEKFAQCVGETPMRYLARWRMQLAAGMLQQTRLPLEAIAEDVGYHSEAAFNRAFKNIVGIPPGAWRRNQAANAAE